MKNHKIISCILAVAMVIPLFSVPVLADGEPCDNWEYSDSLPSEGSYKLTSDVVISSEVKMSGKTLSIDLNGYNISYAEGATGRIYNLSGSKLNITNSAETRSTISGCGNYLGSSTKGGLFFVGKNSELSITNVDLTKGVAHEGGAVGVDGDGSQFSMTNGSISYCEAAIQGGAINIGSQTSVTLTNVNVHHNVIGRISNGTSTKYRYTMGGGIRVGMGNATLTLDTCQITDNEIIQGESVDPTNGKAGGAGIVSDVYTNIITIKGPTIIANNDCHVANCENYDNLYLDDATTINIGERFSGSRIGISRYSNYISHSNALTSGLSGNEDCFFSDLNGYYLTTNSSGELIFDEQSSVKRVEGMSLILDEGKIGVKYYVSGADQDSTMTFTVAGKQQTSDATAVGNYFCFVCEVAAPQMTETISAVLTSGGSDYQMKDFTVKSYADYISNHPDDFGSKAVTLAQSLLTYGAYSQLLFNKNTGNLAANVEGVDCSASFTFDTTQAPGTLAMDLSIDGLTYSGASLVLNSETSLKLYFKLEDGYNITDFNSNFVQSGNYYYLKIADIDVGKLGEWYDFTIGGQTIWYSPMIYMNNNQSSSNNNLANTMKALYLYREAALAYTQG